MANAIIRKTPEADARFYRAVREYLTSGTLPQTGYQPNQFEDDSRHFKLVDGKLYFCKRLVLENEEDQKKAIIDMHVDKSHKHKHKSVQSTLKSVENKYFWGSIKFDVEEIVENCNVCHPSGDDNLQIWNYIELGVLSDNVLLLIDIGRKSSIFKCISIKNCQPEPIADTLVSLFGCYGIPKGIKLIRHDVIDCDFVEEFKTCLLNKFNHIFSLKSFLNNHNNNNFDIITETDFNNCPQNIDELIDYSLKLIVDDDIKKKQIVDDDIRKIRQLFIFLSKKWTIDNKGLNKLTNLVENIKKSDNNWENKLNFLPLFFPINDYKVEIKPKKSQTTPMSKLEKELKRLTETTPPSARAKREFRKKEKEENSFKEINDEENAANDNKEFLTQPSHYNHVDESLLNESANQNDLTFVQIEQLNESSSSITVPSMPTFNQLIEQTKIRITSRDSSLQQTNSQSSSSSSSSSLSSSHVKSQQLSISSHSSYETQQSDDIPKLNIDKLAKMHKLKDCKVFLEECSVQYLQDLIDGKVKFKRDRKQTKRFSFDVDGGDKGGGVKKEIEPLIKEAKNLQKEIKKLNAQIKNKKVKDKKNEKINGKVNNNNKRIKKQEEDKLRKQRKTLEKDLELSEDSSNDDDDDDDVSVSDGRNDNDFEVPIDDLPGQVYQCEHCPFSTNSKINLFYHSGAHKSKSHYCEDCCQRFMSKESLIKHRRDVHLIEEPNDESVQIPNQTPIRTPSQTPKQTPKQTPIQRSNQKPIIQNNKEKDINEKNKEKVSVNDNQNKNKNGSYNQSAKLNTNLNTNQDLNNNLNENKKEEKKRSKPQEAETRNAADYLQEFLSNFDGGFDNDQYDNNQYDNNQQVSYDVNLDNDNLYYNSYDNNLSNNADNINDNNNTSENLSHNYNDFGDELSENDTNKSNIDSATNEVHCNNSIYDNLPVNQKVITKQNNQSQEDEEAILFHIPEEEQEADSDLFVEF